MPPYLLMLQNRKAVKITVQTLVIILFVIFVIVAFGYVVSEAATRLGLK